VLKSLGNGKDTSLKSDDDNTTGSAHGGSDGSDEEVHPTGTVVLETVKDDEGNLHQWPFVVLEGGEKRQVPRNKAGSKCTICQGTLQRRGEYCRFFGVGKGKHPKDWPKVDATGN